MKFEYQDTSTRITLEDIDNLPSDLQQGLYNAMRYDLALFAWICFPHIVKDVPDFHKDIYKVWDDIALKRIDFAAFVVFRDAAKSTLKNIKIIHDICYGLEEMILFLAEAKDQVNRDVDAIEKEIEKNPIIRALYGDLKGGGVWSKSEAEFANGCYLVGKGWKSRTRGVKFEHFRPSLIILDDFEGEQNTENDTTRAKVRKWIEAIVIPAGDVDVRVIFMGTIVHPDSYLANLKTHGMMSGPRSVYYEKSISEYEKDGKIIKDFKYNHPVWPERYNSNWFAKQRKIYFGGKNPRPALFYQELFNIPEQESDPIFDASQLTEVNATFHKKKTITYLKYAKDDGSFSYIGVHTFNGVDPNHRDKKYSDPFCSITIGIDANENVYIINIINEVLKLEERIDTCSDEGKRYGTRCMTVESYGAQYDLMHWIKKKNLDTGYHFPLDGFEERKSKSKKWTEGLAPILNSGKIYYLKGCPHIEELKQQLKLNSGNSEHDDLIDAIFLALYNSFPPPRVNIKKRLAEIDNRRVKTKKNKRNWYSL